MKILAINGSPKGNRSNTWRLASAFLEGITAKEESSGSRAPEIETLNIGSLNLKPCLGCFSCWSKTPGECCIHDDMQGVINKILWADVVVNGAGENGGNGDNGSNGGSSSADANVNANTVNNNGDKAANEAKATTVKTGDNLALIGGAFALVAVAAAGIAVFALRRKEIK